MTNINVGLTANDGLGAKLRDAMIIVNNNFNELQTEIDNISLSVTIGDVTGLQTVLDGLQSEIDQLELDLASSNSTINTTISGITASIVSLQGSINSLIASDIIINNNINNISNSVNTINTNITTINTNITTINNTLTDIINDIESLETPTLDQVTQMGNTSSNSIRIGSDDINSTISPNQIEVVNNNFTDFNEVHLDSTEILLQNSTVFSSTRVQIVGENINTNNFISNTYTSLVASDGLILSTSGNGSRGRLATDLLLSNRTYQLPNNDGTIALLSDITPGEPSQLQLLNEGNGNGWRLYGKNAANYGNIGLNAVDFSHSSGASSTRGASGQQAFVTGLNNIGSGNNCLIGGSSNTVSGSDSASFGQANSVSSAQALCYGFFNTITAINSTYAFAGGYQNVVEGQAGVSIGYFNISKSLGECVVGMLSSDISGNSSTFVLTDTAFRVGISDGSFGRRDGFRVYKNGALYLFPQTTSNITNGANGFLHYNNTTKKLASHDGISWKDYAHIGTVAPSSATDIGTVGEIRVTSTFIYTCIATNTWVRAAMTTW